MPRDDRSPGHRAPRTAHRPAQECTAKTLDHRCIQCLLLRVAARGVLEGRLATRLKEYDALTLRCKPDGGGALGKCDDHDVNMIRPIFFAERTQRKNLV